MTYDFPKSSCLFKSRTFPESSILCNNDRCIQCMDGSWADELEWDFPPLVKEIHVVPGDDFSEL